MPRAMSWVFGLFLFLVTVAAMEGVAYAAHRWVMHGPGWFLHKSHHRPRQGWFELNDLYGFIFAVPSIALIYVGMQGNWPGWTKWGFGAEVAAMVMEEAFDHLDAPVARVGMRDVPMPYNDTLERAVIPSQADIVAAVRRVLYR